MTLNPGSRTPTPRQEELVDRALELVREAGLAGLTVRRLAERVGFTEAALYRHFASKQSLLLALMDRAEKRLLGPIWQLAENEELPVETRLEAILRHHARMVVATEGLPVLLLAEATASGDDVLLARIRSTFDEYTQVIERLLARLPPRDDRPTAAQLTLLLIGLPAATAIHLRLGAGPPMGGDASDRLASFLVRQVIAA